MGALAGFLAAGAVLLAQTLGDTYARRFYVDSDGTFGGAAPVIRSGTGSPEGAVTGSVGDLFLRTDGGSSTTLYIKESGTGNTGWSATAASTGAPADATYVTQTANGTLSAEQALSSLASGIMRVATTTGVVSSLTDSAGIATNISDETGTGLMVFDTSPVLVTPTLGVASATSLSASGVVDAATLRTSGSTDCDLTSGTGAPEGAVTGDVCDLFLRTDGGTTTTLYVKESGTATNTGWVAAGAGGGGAGALGDWYETIVKTSDESVANSTTLQDDDDLLFAVGASETWAFEFVVLYTGSTAGDLRMVITAPAGVTGGWAPEAVGGTPGNYVPLGKQSFTDSDFFFNPAAGTTGSDIYAVRLAGVVTTTGTSGNVTLRWAQQSSNATPTVVEVGSSVTYWRTDGRLRAGITASVTQTQGQEPLNHQINEVSTVANTNDTVTLPTAVAARSVVVINNGANTLQIFPASGDNLGAGVDTATTLATGTNVEYVAYDTTNWEVR